ncbi:MAG TPA: cytochrome c biogenesis CcdA family protein [Candidatus Paceibacterota bacterium]|nr:cytochrome c biogenesis CcdA family protein [Candidatus Paceibacterota bacterium]
MLDVSLFSAFFAGLLTFLAPCTLPLVPAYLAFLASETGKLDEKKIFQRALAFMVGFSSVIVLLGVFVNQLGRYIAAYRGELIMFGGLLFVLFGLTLLGVIKIPVRSAGMPAFLKPTSNFAVGLLGVVFAFGWSPCVGPILGSIYVLAAQADTVVRGTLLLVLYAVGHSLPFILLAYFYERSFKVVSVLSRYSEKISRGAGIILVIIGLFMLVGQYGFLLSIFGKFVDGDWQEKLLNYL